LSQSLGSESSVEESSARQMRMVKGLRTLWARCPPCEFARERSEARMIEQRLEITTYACASGSLGSRASPRSRSRAASCQSSHRYSLSCPRNTCTIARFENRTPKERVRTGILTGAHQEHSEEPSAAAMPVFPGRRPILRIRMASRTSVRASTAPRESALAREVGGARLR
jgi:hypothetical protein